MENIESKMIRISRESCEKAARRIFDKIAGPFMTDIPCKDEMMDRIAAAYEKTADAVDVKFVYSFFTDVILKKNDLLVGNREFHCPVFGEMDQNHIRGAWVYTGTAGKFPAHKAMATEDFFADIWETAFLCAGRERFEEHLRSDREQCYISEGFGPGFFAMEEERMDDIAVLSGSEAIGVRVNDKHVLIPPKSCGGIYLCSARPFTEMKGPCGYCKGAVDNCNMCLWHIDDMYGQREEDEEMRFE